MSWLSLLLLFLRELIVSALKVAWLVVQPRLRIRPAFRGLARRKKKRRRCNTKTDHSLHGADPCCVREDYPSLLNPH